MGTWRGDPDDAAARFLAEHGMVAGLDGDELVIEAGNEALLPPWPPKLDGGRESRVTADSHAPAPVDEQVPCPTCWLPADLIGPTDVDVLHHSRCPRGHDNTLAPVVLAHLRTL